MKRQSYRMLALAAVAALLATLATRPARADERDERAIRALIDQSVQAANSTDPKLMERNLANHDPNGGPFYHPFVMSLATLADVRALVAQVSPQVATHHYQITGPVKIQPGKYVSWAAFTWHAEVSFKDGTNRSFDGRSTITFGRNKEDHPWKITHWHSSIPAAFPLTTSARQGEAQQILQIERSAWDAIQNKQPAALGNYFADNASVFNEQQAYRVTGKDNLMRGLREFIQNTDLRSYQMLEPQVDVMGETALLTYYYTLAGTRSGKPFSAAGKATIVFVRQGGTWKVLHEHTSLNR